jgi:hypothetical protein
VFIPAVPAPTAAATTKANPTFFMTMILSGLEDLTPCQIVPAVIGREFRASGSMPVIRPRYRKIELFGDDNRVAAGVAGGQGH